MAGGVGHCFPIVHCSSCEMDELQLALALSASEVTSEEICMTEEPKGKRKRRGQKVKGQPPPLLASLSTSEVQKRIETRAHTLIQEKVCSLLASPLLQPVMYK